MPCEKRLMSRNTGKKYPAVSGLKYWPNLTTALRELYVEKLQKLMERL